VGKELLLILMIYYNKQKLELVCSSLLPKEIEDFKNDPSLNLQPEDI